MAPEDPGRGAMDTQPDGVARVQPHGNHARNAIALQPAAVHRAGNQGDGLYPGSILPGATTADTQAHSSSGHEIPDAKGRGAVLE